jgi:hypothetical protein
MVTIGTCADDGVGEPDDTMVTAYDMGTISDSDGDGGAIEGVIAGSLDMDWYMYRGEDGLLAIVNPSIEFEGAVEVCMYADCYDADATDARCEGDATPDTDASGLNGCCHDAAFELDLNCEGTTSDDAIIYIKVMGMDATCEDYSFDYHY